MVKPIPEGYHTITPFLIVNSVISALDFYKKVFSAVESHDRFEDSSGRIGYAEIKIEDSKVILSDEYPELGIKSPTSLKGSPITLLIYVKDVDDVVNRAIKAGAKLTQPVENRIYGDRSGQIQDPFGHIWTISTHIEDVLTEELIRRLREK